MADPPPPKKPQTPQQRASFARAERLRREAGQDRPKRKIKADGAQKARPFETKLAAARPQQRSPWPAPSEHQVERLRRVKEDVAIALENLDILRQETKRRRLERKGLDTRTAFVRAVDRRRDQGARTGKERRQTEIAKGMQRRADWAKRQERKAQERRRQDMRKEFARKAEDRRDAALKQAEQQRQARLKAVARQAAAAIEADHKRQRDEQQQAHRRETDQVRNRHRRDMDSLRSNETAAIERHAGTIQRLDGAEQRALSDLVARQKSLVGRVAGLKPGSARQRERDVQAVRDRYEAERMKTHRDLEALKERQFQHAQTTRLQHAKERLASMHEHRDSRDALQQRQQTDRPRLIEGKQRAMVAAQEHAPAQDRQHSRAESGPPLAPAFNEKAR